MDTLLLDRSNWDLCKNAAGDIAMASDPYAIAQDVASAIKLFLGELWYDTTKGVPYFGQILGERPPLTFLKAKFIAAALTVPEVVSAVCYIESITGRTIIGQVQVTDKTGAITTVGF